MNIKQINNDRKSLFSQYSQIVFVVSTYWIVSILTVFVNKTLFSSKTINLDAPLFITWFQCLVSSIICFSLSNLNKMIPSIISFPIGNPFNKKTFIKILPLSILFTLMIATNNLCLKYVGVAFYYVGRSLTTVFNVIFTYLLLGQKTSFKCILCCAMIIGGFFLGVDQESATATFSLIGTVFGVLGSISLSLYSIYTKKSLVFVNQEVWLLSYYNNVYSVFIFLPLIVLSGEVKEILNYEHLFEIWFWGAMTIGGLCGLAIGYCTALQIKVTSPLTHNISGTAKACAQTVIAVEWYNESKSILWWISNMIVLGNSGLYARFKQKEMEIKHYQEISNQKV